MTRDIKAPALVLKMNPVGENHRGISMLVSGEGLLRPFAYGAQGKRSALRASAVPYNRGTADLHYDASKDSWRLTAFDAEETHDGLREDLDRFYAATTWVEILLGTHGGGGDSAELYELAAEALHLLSGCGPKDMARLEAGFLWRFLGIEGVRPDPMRCGGCGRSLPVGGSAGPARFRHDGLLVGGCCSEARGTEVPDGARRWLEAVSGGGLDASLSIGLQQSAASAAKRWLLVLVQAMMERPLKSLRTGPFGAG
jgi:DNA repair protein RecO